MRKSISPKKRRMNDGKDTRIHFTHGASTRINKHHLHRKDQGTKMQRRHKLNYKSNHDKTWEHFIPISKRKRFHNQHDPSLQGYFEWPSTNWTEYFEEERQPPASSSSSWSPNSTWWSSSSWTPSWQAQLARQ